MFDAFRSSRRRTAAAAVSGALALVACKPHEPEAAPKPVESAPVVPYATAAAGRITADYLRDQITKFSGDEFQGRGPATKGDVKAREYLLEQLRQLGFDGAHQQTFDVVGVTASMPEQWSFKKGSRTVSFKWSDQYIAGSGVQTETGSISSAEVVFVGYGIQAPEYGWDDFKGRDLKGKVLLMLNNDPDWDEQLFAGSTRLYYGRRGYKYESAARQGAAGAIIIHTNASAGYPFQVVQTSGSGEQFELPGVGEPRIQVKGWLVENAARELVRLGGQDLEQLIASARSRNFHPVSLGVTTSIEFANRINRSSTANVYGVLRGSDPVLDDEYLIYTAHHDHLGIGKPNRNGDNIYNGALDNATGVAQVLAIGKALQALPRPPKRSVMLLFVAAEEQGLLGSQYFAAHPIISPGKMVANINYDGGNIWGRTADVIVIGKGRSSIDDYVTAAALTQGRTVKPDQYADQGLFYRSDQFNFARIGVPAVNLDPGLDFYGRSGDWGKDQLAAYEQHHYHQPSDEITDGWNFDGMTEDAQLGFHVGNNIADAAANELPKWHAGDEFEAARKAALVAIAKAE